MYVFNHFLLSFTKIQLEIDDFWVSYFLLTFSFQFYCFFEVIWLYDKENNFVYIDS